jgi:hypothetical protein
MVNMWRMSNLLQAWPRPRAGTSGENPHEGHLIDLDESSMASNDASHLDLPSPSTGSSESPFRALHIKDDDEVPTEHDDQDSAKAGMGSPDSSPVSWASPASPPVVVPYPV